MVLGFGTKKNKDQIRMSIHGSDAASGSITTDTDTDTTNTAATGEKKKQRHQEDETSSVLSASASSLSARQLSGDSNHSLKSTASSSSPSAAYKNYVPCESDWPYIWVLRDGTYLDWKRRYVYSDPSEMAAQVISHLQLPVRIDRQLYLGNAVCLTDVASLQEKGITGVLHMAGASKAVSSSTVRQLKKAGIAYHSISAQDRCNYPLLYLHWEEAYQTIQEFMTVAADSNSSETGKKNKKKKNKVLVTCVQGINRSSLIVAAYYMITTQTSVLETMRHIRHERGNECLTNEGFQEQLVAFARAHKLRGYPPGHTMGIVPAVPPPRAMLGNSAAWRTPSSLSSAHLGDSQSSLDGSSGHSNLRSTFKGLLSFHKK
jgi:protein-tyrosine phosphatase